MPMGMHSLVSDGGGTLSGGQRQRLLIARAIVNKPRIIYFDEATSALDNQSQAVVSASMKKLRATRVVIAHRLSTIIDADRIFVLDRGRIVQAGTYDELIGQDGLFAELAKRQMA
jgi:ATP-binding cassette subfamily C protein